MPFILTTGEEIHIDYSTVIKDTCIVIEYSNANVKHVTQTMSTFAANIFSSAFSGAIVESPILSQNDLISFDFHSNENIIQIKVDSLKARVDESHMMIDYFYKNEKVLSQRTSLETVKAIAEEIVA